MIEVEHLCKSYDDNPAVKDLSFSIEEGHATSTVFWVPTAPENPRP